MTMKILPLFYILYCTHASPSLEELGNYRNHLNFSPEWNPKTEGWTKYMERRMAQIARIEDEQQKFDGYLVALQQGILINNFTENGYSVVDCPKEIYNKLYKSFHDSFDTKKRRYEGKVDQIHCESEDGNQDKPCDKDEQAFIVNTGLNSEILNELKPYHEEWSNVPLTPSIAYGIRVYQNGSSLTMHTDRIETHVISCILHVDRDYGDREPWPIVIEGYDGITTSIDLKPGQMLFYESAKCMHGRPVTFRGNWYASMFIHYRPTAYQPTTSAERIALVPDTWRNSNLPPINNLPKLTVFGTGFKERECKHGWCSLLEDELQKIKENKNEKHIHQTKDFLKQNKRAQEDEL